MKNKIIPLNWLKQKYKEEKNLEFVGTITEEALEFATMYFDKKTNRVKERLKEESKNILFGVEHKELEMKEIIDKIFQEEIGEFK